MDSRIPIKAERTASYSLPCDPETAASSTATSPADRPDWVDAARRSLDAPGRYLAYEDSGHRIVVPVSGELTRIGRSLSAQLRFDDATVSRRHAVIAADPAAVRVLDDRSLNGVYVNGIRVDDGVLHDGDVIGIGRHSIWFLDNARVGGDTTSAVAPD
jgi:pSer/pThr/pTyr-binding forkhead associated (FHA) protein